MNRILSQLIENTVLFLLTLFVYFGISSYVYAGEVQLETNTNLIHQAERIDQAKAQEAKPTLKILKAEPKAQTQTPFKNQSKSKQKLLILTFS